MKSILVVAACFFYLQSTGQDTKANFDGKAWVAPYSLDVPNGWDVERFLIPISFAPLIQYTGVEDIRFTPGWGKIETNDYWSYAFLWYLDNRPEFNPAIIEKNLIAYYTGLFKINTDKNKIDTTRIVPVTASIEKKATEQGDLQTFQGSVNMMDYMTKKPLTVNLIIHVKSCEGQNNTFVFHEVSPKPFTDNVWNGLNQLWTNFKCPVFK